MGILVDLQVAASKGAKDFIIMSKNVNVGNQSLCMTCVWSHLYLLWNTNGLKYIEVGCNEDLSAKSLL